MALVIHLDTSEPSNLGYRRARRGKLAELERAGQLNLFKPTQTKVMHLPPSFSPFEEALRLDENGDGGAQEAYLKAIIAGDCVADANCNIGILESQSGNIIKAFDYFTECLRHEPRHLEAHYNLGNLYFEQCDYRLARLHYEIAAEIEPDFSDIYFNLGLVYAMNKENEDAFSALMKYKTLVSPAEGNKANILLATIERTLTSPN